MNAPSNTSELTDRRPAGGASRLTPSLVGGLVAIAVIVAAGTGLFYAAHQFGNYELEQHDTRASRPRVTGSTPVSGETRVPAQATFRANLFLPGTGDSVDVASAEQGVRLTRTRDNAAVEANITVAADSGSVTLTPVRPLTPGESYRFEVTRDFVGTDGLPFVPFAASVRVDPDSPIGYAEADLELEGVAFEQVPQAEAVVEPSKFTALAWGPSSIAGSDRPDLFAGT
ncbi:MAG: Ig-like domain-containing protein, partial [Planctomycetota bacterium]